MLSGNISVFHVSASASQIRPHIDNAGIVQPQSYSLACHSIARSSEGGIKIRSRASWDPRFGSLGC